MKVSIEIRAGHTADAKRIPPTTKVFECESMTDAATEAARIIEDELQTVRQPNGSVGPSYIYRDLRAVTVKLAQTDE
jgi:hypothetical protein